MGVHGPANPRRHRVGDEVSDVPRRLDEMPDGKVGVVRCGPVAPVPKYLMGNGEILSYR